MAAAVGFVIRLREVGLGFRQLCFGIEDRDVIRGLINMKQHVARVDKLVVFNLQVSDGAGHLRRDADLLGAHLAVTGPG